MLTHRNYELRNGKRPPSVTEIIGILRKPKIERWRGEVTNIVADRIIRQSQIKGTSIHSLIEYYLRNGHLPRHSDSEHLVYANHFVRWYNDNVKSDRAVISESKRYAVHTVDGIDYDFCGTVDIIADLQDIGSCVLDVKTGKSLHPTVKLQTAAYSYLHRFNTPECKSLRRAALHITKDGAYMSVFDDDSKDEQAFLSMIPAYYALCGAGYIDSSNGMVLA